MQVRVRPGLGRGFTRGRGGGGASCQPRPQRGAPPPQARTAGRPLGLGTRSFLCRAAPPRSAGGSEGCMECVYTGRDGRADSRSCLSSLHAPAKPPPLDPHHPRSHAFAGFTTLPRAGQTLPELPVSIPWAEDPLWARAGWAVWARHDPAGSVRHRCTRGWGGLDEQTHLSGFNPRDPEESPLLAGGEAGLSPGSTEVSCLEPFS